MRLKFIILANAAEVGADGKLTMMGADFDVIRTASFPAMHPVLNVVVKLLASPEEVGTEHSVKVELFDPHENLLGSLEHKANPPVHPYIPGKDVGVGVIAQFGMVPIVGPGKFSVRVSVDGEVVGTSGFEAMLNAK